MNKLLTPEIEKAIHLQFPDDAIIEVGGKIWHFPDEEQNWYKIAEKVNMNVFFEVRPDSAKSTTLMSNLENRNAVLYDPNEFRLAGFGNGERLEYIGDGEFHLPINARSCRRMFANKTLSDNFSFGDEDFSKIEDMERMFNHCKFPRNFTLGDNFNTINVRSMHNMFRECDIPVNFSLGSKFNTSNVTTMESMFQGARIWDGLDFGDHFDTHNVECFTGMFCECIAGGAIKLPDTFVLDKAKDLVDMFRDSQLSDDFYVGDNFHIPADADLKNMFTNCTLPGKKSKINFNSNKAIVAWLNRREEDSSDWFATTTHNAPKKLRTSLEEETETILGDDADRKAKGFSQIKLF